MSLFSQATRRLKNHLINIPGWRTDRKIVVFESDDWGMIRMASKDAFERLHRKGYLVDKCLYNRNDALERAEDLTGLLEVLSSVKDSKGNFAKFTLNNIVANPNFEKIADSEFEKYFFEPFTESLERYSDGNKVLELYKEGYSKGVFQFQFHGREHVHVNNWLCKLREKDRLFIDAFRENMFTQFKGKPSSCRIECLDAMAIYNSGDIGVVMEALREGLDLFHSIWGFKSKSVIAPCYTWNIPVERKLSELGVKYLQGGRAQRSPVIDGDGYAFKRHFCGQKNNAGMIYLVRNVHFEQVEDRNKDWVTEALSQISRAFTWQKPAIISTHRVNYIGSINPQNRDINLNILSDLLKRIVKKWPSVEFLSSDQMGDEIASIN